MAPRIARDSGECIVLGGGIRVQCVRLRFVLRGIVESGSESSDPGGGVLVRAGESEWTALLRRPAFELAELVCSGQVRSRELVDAVLAQIEAKQALNAFTFVDAEGARAAADAITPGDPRPFAGVP